MNAVIHGNEICGAIALDFLLSSGYAPTRGKLTVRPSAENPSLFDVCVSFS
eukprot:COSAG06_NODE_13265_length_1276_cov_1.375531_1_plen_51_part_00